MDVLAIVRDKDLIDELKRKRLVVPASNIRGDFELIPSGLDELDGVCGGGLPAGRITEVVAPSCGRSTVLYSLLASVTSRGELAALVDPSDGLNVASAHALGVDLERLLWVRARSIKEALQAIHLVLETGGFGMVALDMGECRRQRSLMVPDAAWMRIKNLASTLRAVVLVVSEASEVGTFASLTVQVQRRRARWQGRAPMETWFEGVDLSFSLCRKKV